MTKIAAVVLNSVSHDARVLKEADSLARAGYDITVFGIRDNRDKEPVTVRDSGARIVRVAWKADSYRMLARALMALSTMVALALLALALFLAEPVTNVMQAMARRLLTPGTVGAGLVVVGLGVWWTLDATARSFRRSAAILDAQDEVLRAGPGGAGRSVRWHPARVVAAVRRRGRTMLRRTRARSPSRALRVLLARKFGSITLQRRLRDAVVGLGPAVVHCHDLPTVPIGIRAARRTGAKVVYDAHEIYEEVSQLTERRRRRYRAMQRRVSGHVDGLVTVNDAIHEFLRSSYPRLPEGEVVCNAVLPPDGPPVDDGRLRDRAAVADGQRILLYQGGFARFRGLDVLVRAAPLLPQDWTLVMMGWGAYEAELVRIAHLVDPEQQRVRFIPGAPHAELRQWTAGADLGVIPYENVCLNHWFCSPNKLWEYPTAGVPILASPYPVLREVVVGNGIGLLLEDPATPEGIAGAVAGITSEDLAAMKAATIPFVTRDNWEKYEERLLSLYGRLLDARPTRTADAMARS